MRVKDYTTAASPILVSEEAVLDDMKLTCVVTCRLSFHDSSVLALTLLHEASYETHFILSDLNFELILQQLDHSLKIHKQRQVDRQLLKPFEYNLPGLWGSLGSVGTGGCLYRIGFEGDL